MRPFTLSASRSIGSSPTTSAVFAIYYAPVIRQARRPRTSPELRIVLFLQAGHNSAHRLLNLVIG